ncbi:MAG: urease accessory protein UreF [Betaproteobacteria bacterium]|nr:urease accessory protein UreF [Betaproteobacteria bacterium]MBA3775099.1 urease accessory protein UreF [Betaproteobacteria bacterium]
MSGAVTSDKQHLARLLQLASPTLPIGAYSYSQGLEWLVAAGTVTDAATAQRWIGDVLEYFVAPGEAAVLWRLSAAAMAEDRLAFAGWNAWLRASRETSELRAETEQMGNALVKLTTDLGCLDEFARGVAQIAAPITLPAAFALAARGFGVAPETALTAYLWSWLDNQVLAAVKIVPLGQVAGQRMLLALGSGLAAAASHAKRIADDDMASFAPGLALASARHETQYTRLFRS